MTWLQRNAISYIRDHPGCRAHAIADAIAPRKNGWTPQGATRWVAALLQDQIKSGRVTRRRGNGLNLDYYVGEDNAAKLFQEASK